VFSVELWAHSNEPAGGAALSEILIASVIAVIGLIVLAFFTRAYRAGGMNWLRSLGSFSERVSGLPAWAAIPVSVTAVSAIVAAFGFYWDVSTHIDNGRDAGPFANPSHFFILFGLVGIALAGYLSGLFATEKGPEKNVSFAGWTFPIGGLLLLICGSIALLGFPLDDTWHRLFGQDVTLWGPTHIQMVGGASLSTLAMWILVRETDPYRREDYNPWFLRGHEIAIAGAFLIGLSTLQAEFDFAVPQFRLVYHPVLLMLASSIGLVAARIRLGRGGAVKAVLFFLLIRGVLSLLVGPVLGRITLHFPLYLVEALMVELAAVLVGAEKRTRFALASGLGIGTIGLAAEWAWSHVWMMNPWPAALLPEGAIAGLVAALGGAIVGALIGTALNGDAELRMPRKVAIAGGVAAVACLVYPAPMSTTPVVAHVTLDRATPDSERAIVNVRLDPPDAAENNLWFHSLAWQGLDWDRGSSVHSQMEETGPGTYRSQEPVPAGGDWKSLVRLHVDDRVMAVPIYLPEDPAIPAPEVPAEATFAREFVADKEIVQREAISDNIGLQRIAYGILLAIGIIWIASMGWGLARLVHNLKERRSESRRRKLVTT
jgi:hypothetical protein